MTYQSRAATRRAPSFCCQFLRLGIAASVVFGASSSSAQDSSAEWIWSSKSAGDNDRFATRAHVELAEDAAKKPARLTVSCDNWAKVWVNGNEAFVTTEWSAPGRLNVAKWLKAGNNVIAIEARNQGGSAGLLAELKVGGKVVVDSGADWKFSNKRPKGWEKADFDDSKWNAVANRVVDALVTENSLRVAVWIKTLNSARRHLIKPVTPPS